MYVCVCVFIYVCESKSAFPRIYRKFMQNLFICVFEFWIYLICKLRTQDLINSVEILGNGKSGEMVISSKIAF